MIKKLTILFVFLFCFQSFSQDNYLGKGPFSQLIIRGVTLINGDGSPPRGPIDIVVENDKIIMQQNNFLQRVKERKSFLIVVVHEE